MCRQDAFPRTSLAMIGTDVFADIGPVLCLYPGCSGEVSGWRRARAVCAERCVDAKGVRESLRFFDDDGRSCLRWFLLPDSDYPAWESLRARLPWVAAESRVRACAAYTLQRLCTRERSWKVSLLRLAPGVGEWGATMGWARVSDVGRGIARRIALAEGAAPAIDA